MKAISVHQPYASLWARGIKKNETRGWKTNHRGPLLVHAAKRWTTDEKETTEGYRYLLGDGELPLGALIGVVKIVGMVTGYEGLSDLESRLGWYGPGRFGWAAEDFLLFETPIPYKGQQGLFDVPDDLIRAHRLIRSQESGC